MLSILERLRRKMFQPVPRRKPPQTPRFAKPRLEALEDRLVLDAMLFIGASNIPALPALWSTAGNWTDLNTGANRIPTAGDDVGIPGAAGFVSLAGVPLAEINSIVTGAGSTLTIPTGVELKIDSNPPASEPPAMPTSPVAGSNYFGGSVNDAGLINANTTNVFTGTQVIFAGGASIGPGDLNGNLAAGPNSAFTFDGGGSGAANTFLAGATFGQSSGSVIIASPVTVNGTLEDQSMVTNVVTGGDLTGPGSLSEQATLNWTGGTISLAGGVDVNTTGDLNTSGPDTKFLSTVLTNGVTTNLGGSGTLSLLTGGSITNGLGATMNVSLPSIITTGGGAGLTNDAGGILNATAPASTPTVIAVPFTNDGNLFVQGNSALELTTPLGPGGTPAIDLNGTVGLDGFLYLYSTATSTTGFNLTHQSSFFEVGSANGGSPGTLIVPSGVTDTVNGNLEINNGSKLTGGGTVSNGGRLQLDVGSTTVGLGYYVQSNSGTLAEVVVGNELFTPLTVVHTATLSGTLVLPGYTGVVGDSFTVVIAGELLDKFDANGIPQRHGTDGDGHDRDRHAGSAAGVNVSYSLSQTRRFLTPSPFPTRQLTLPVRDS